MEISIISKIPIAIIALLHIYFLWLEMFRWTTHGPKVFKNFTAATFDSSRVLAANQGLYNGFLAAGLIWSLVISDPQWAQNVATFFLFCVSIAGVYAGITIDRKIAAVQAAPAVLALLIILVQ